MTTRIAVLDDAGSVSLRCESCGLICPVPPDMGASPLHDFVRQHQLEVDPLLHPSQCPAWGLTSDNSSR